MARMPSILISVLARFVKNNGMNCPKSKQEVGHLEKVSKTKNKTKLTSIEFDSYYLLFTRANGVHARFIGIGQTIWVPSNLETNKPWRTRLRQHGPFGWGLIFRMCRIGDVEERGSHLGAK